MTDFSIENVTAQAPTTHAELLQWVADIAQMTQPDRIYWADGTQQEYDRLAGSWLRLVPSVS